ncbi:MAG: hypothetical protein Udaeo_12580 [Candidatus Udaeobacter sp.]|nr:MAG: hypothetical protein Udaeo_12580 [Candidatus Udaeobacter sp.]
MHRRTATITIAEVKIVTHADLIAVVDDRCAGHGEQQGVEQLNFSAVIRKQRTKPPADAKIDTRMRIGRVNSIHVVALLVGHHFQRKLVVVAQKHCPLTILRDRRRLLHDVDNRKPVLHLERHEHARHKREMKIHVRLVAFPKICSRVLRPLIGL